TPKSSTSKSKHSTPSTRRSSATTVNRASASENSTTATGRPRHNASTTGALALQTWISRRARSVTVPELDTYNWLQDAQRPHFSPSPNHATSLRETSHRQDFL